MVITNLDVYIAGKFMHALEALKLVDDEAINYYNALITFMILNRKKHYAQ